MRALAVLLVLAGCADPLPDDGSRAVSGGPVAPGAPELPSTPHGVRPIDDGDVAVIVAKERFATITRAQLRAGVRLDELVERHPYTMWASITTSGPGVAPTTWLEPVTTVPGLVPLVYLDGPHAAIALVDPSRPDPRAADLRVTGIDEVRIDLARRPRTVEDALADGCQPEADDGVPQPKAPRRWKGSTHQFNTGTTWRHRYLEVDLAPGPPGERVGTDVQIDDWDGVCRYDFVRRADRRGRRVIYGRVRKPSWCVDVIYELACSGTALEVWGYYGHDGRYVEHGFVEAVPEP